MARKLLRFLDGLITGLVVVALVISGAYAGYALWDNQQVYDTAESVYSEMREIRASLPDASSSSMEQLLEEYRKARTEAVVWQTEPGEKPEFVEVVCFEEMAGRGSGFC